MLNSSSKLFVCLTQCIHWLGKKNNFMGILSLEALGLTVHSRNVTMATNILT